MRPGPGKNVPPKNPRHILELSDDGDAASQPLKKATAAGPSMSTKPRDQRNQDLPSDDDEDAYPQHKKHPKNSQNGRKKPKAKPTVIESSDDSDSDHISNNDKKKPTTGSRDSDNEKIESPEDELG
jgi:hypothetical protein